MLRRSVRRYLLVKVLPLALLVNVVLNFVVGRILYPAGHAVPLVGAHGIATDTLVGAFLLGLFTLLLGAPVARHEARAGRVRGGGSGRRWLGWLARHPLGGALGFGVASSLVLGVPVLAALAALGVHALERDLFVGFKAAFAGAAGVITAVAAARLAVAPEPDVSHDPRWCRDPALPVGGAVYPCDYIDKGGLAVTDRARGCSGTPTWQLMVAGALDAATVRRALADVMTRYPSLTTRVQSLDAVPRLARRFRYAHDPSFDVDQLFAVVDLRHDPSQLAALTCELHNRHLDLFTDAPLTLTMAITGDDHCRLFFRQHHAIADGRAFIGLLVDFAAFLDDARAGRRPAPSALAPIGRRTELEALGLPRLRRALDTVAGYGWLLRMLWRGLRHPVVALSQNRSNDYRGDNGTVHWLVGDGVLEGWNRARKRIGVSLNSLLTAALFLANQRWHRARGLPLGRTNGNLIMETRPRDGSFISFANHLSTLDVEADLGRVDDLATLARTFQEQVDAQRRARTPIKRLLCERQLVLALPLEVLQRIVFQSERPSYAVNFSNLIALELPTLAGDGWRVEQILITTPVTPRTGIALTAIRYHGQLSFNFNFKSSAATRAETEALCGYFRTLLAELTATEDGAPHAAVDA